MLPSIFSENLFDDFFNSAMFPKAEEDKKGRYIRQERYAGSLSRSFYVGEDVEPQDVKAKYENGVLKLFVPKAEVKQVPAQTAIAIE